MTAARLSEIRKYVLLEVEDPATKQKDSAEPSTEPANKKGDS